MINATITTLPSNLIVGTRQTNKVSEMYELIGPSGSTTFIYDIGLSVPTHETSYIIKNITSNAILSITLQYPSYLDSNFTENVLTLVSTGMTSTSFRLQANQSEQIIFKLNPTKVEQSALSGEKILINSVAINVVPVDVTGPIYIPITS